MFDEPPKLDVEDPQARLVSVDKVLSDANAHLIGLGIDHANKIVGHLRDTEIFGVRDSIIYRLGSIRFHLILLLRAHSQHVAEMNQRTDLPQPMLMERHAEEQVAIFDSIVFHACSLFDYVGNMVGYVCRAKRGRQLQWKGAVRSARDASNDISQSPVAQVLIEASQWVDRLYDHRSDVIHFKMDFGGRTTTWDLMSGNRDVTIYAPGRFVKKLKPLRAMAQDHSLTLRYVSFWLLEETGRVVLEILLKLRDHLEAYRVVAPGKEPLIFDPPLNSSDHAS